MKKTIKTGFALLLLLGCMNGFSQENPTAPTPLQMARIQLIEGMKNYNPAAALATFQQYANQGNPEAMNGLGLIYSQGLGVTANEVLAVEWFEKAAQKNYAKSYHNLATLYKKGVAGSKDLTKALSHYQKAAELGYDEAWYEWGMMHKNGLGTPQDDQKALAIFTEGATKGFYNAMYAQGYMTYKGLGTKQDYTAAVALFEKAAKNNSAGMYMLGICYRNGYGVDKDEQKGIYWLNKSAAMGYTFAQKELKEVQPENAAPNQSKTLSAPIAQSNDAPIEAPVKLQKVAQKHISGDMSGLYTGTLLRYDFSGQNVISTTPIEVRFDQNGKALSGIWKEQAGDSIAFTATVNEKNIVFANSSIERVEHFSHNQLKKYSFKEAQLQLVENQDDLYIVGNLQLYDIKESEPEKPMYLILTRKNDHLQLEDAQHIVSQLLVYPNPITTGQFNLYFDLAQQTPITVKIYDLMGVQYHEQQLTTTGTGQQEQAINFTAPAGNYVLNLYYGSYVLRTILIKK
jgi:uncharacterized protein